MTRPNLFLRGSTYYLRRQAPKDLQATYGTEIWRSLKTKNKAEAVVRLHAAMAELDREFMAKRAEQTFTQSPAFAGAIGKLSASLPQPLVHPADPPDFVEWAVKSGQAVAAPRDRKAALEAVERAVEWLEDEAAGPQPEIIGSDPATGNPIYRVISHEPILVVPLRYQARVREYLAGLIQADRASLKAVAATIQERKEPEVTKPNGLDQLRERWERVKKPARSSTLEATKAIAEFHALVGSLPIESIAVEHARRYKDFLLEQPIKNATREKKYGMLRAVLGVALEDGTLTDNPFSRVKLGVDDSDAARRASYTLTDLKTIFAKASGTDWWAFRILLFSGMRLGELCQLTAKDIRQEDGIWVFRIRAEEGKRVKTINSIRDIPVHRQLIADGLLERIKDADGLLFPLGAAAMSKALLRRLRSYEFGPEKTVHSFRHTFKTEARRHMDEEKSKWLMGHSNQSVAAQYGDYRDMKKVIDLMTFDLPQAEPDHPIRPFPIKPAKANT